jgi:hypothetical protein
MDVEGVIRKNLEDDPSVIYFLDSQLHITHCNAAWDRFAMENGGQNLNRQYMVGKPVLDSVPQVLKSFYIKAYQKVLASRKPWAHTYECSSANTFRTFHMSVYSDLEKNGLLVVNSLSVERPHGRDREPHQVSPVYSAPHSGFVTLCSHCRRTQRVDHKEIWDWVPAYLERPPMTISHGLCPVCMVVYYPELFEK